MDNEELTLFRDMAVRAFEQELLEPFAGFFVELACKEVDPAIGVDAM